MLVALFIGVCGHPLAPGTIGRLASALVKFGLTQLIGLADIAGRFPSLLCICQFDRTGFTGKPAIGRMILLALYRAVDGLAKCICSAEQQCKKGELDESFHILGLQGKKGNEHKQTSMPYEIGSRSVTSALFFELLGASCLPSFEPKTCNCVIDIFRKLNRLDRFVLSPQEYKRIALLTQLTFIFLIALACFILLDIINGYWMPVPFLALSMGMGMVVLWLTYRGSFLAAKLLLAITVNLVAIFFTFILVRDLGIFLFSICINIGVMAAFGDRNLRFVAPIVLISTALFLAAMFHPFARYRVPPDPNYIAQNLTWSFIIANLASITIVYYFLRAGRVTEARLMEKEKVLVERNQELGKINAELDKFFYSASHDMRAPLASIQGLIQLMERTSNPGELQSYAGMLKERASSLEKFVAQIAEYASNGRQELKSESLVLRQVVRQSLENLRFYPKADSIRFLLEVPESIIVTSDSLRLQIIFGNLLSNAIKYHDFQKPDRYIRIHANERGNQVVVVVEDNGEGIRPENLDSIFGMFTRVNKQVQGSGLGLFIVKDAVQKIGGNITVTSTHGSGTRFEVVLPKSLPAEQSASAA